FRSWTAPARGRGAAGESGARERARSSGRSGRGASRVSMETTLGSSARGRIARRSRNGGSSFMTGGISIMTGVTGPPARTPLRWGNGPTTRGPADRSAAARAAGALPGLPVLRGAGGGRPGGDVVGIPRLRGDRLRHRDPGGGGAVVGAGPASLHARARAAVPDRHGRAAAGRPAGRGRVHDPGAAARGGAGGGRHRPPRRVP